MVAIHVIITALNCCLQKQGDEQISSNHESAFPVAAVAIGVWCECPAVGELLLAHFHRRCPYLVPYHVPKKEGQTSEQYYRWVTNSCHNL